MFSENEIVQKIKRCIGNEVNFKFPGGEVRKIGILMDRAVLRSEDEKTKVPYWDVVDLIKFPEEKQKEWIRIGYYRMPKDSLNWGAQTTIAEPIEVWKKLLIEAAKEKEWFKKLLLEVIQEL